VTSGRHHNYTYADHVGIEMYSDIRHEYLDGPIHAMAGGTEDHSALCVAIGAALFAAARVPCAFAGSPHLRGIDRARDVS
jgi:hypothetical protein